MGTNNVRFIYLSVLIGGGVKPFFEHGIIIWNLFKNNDNKVVEFGTNFEIERRS
jgi:hypothetical protein